MGVNLKVITYYNLKNCLSLTNDTVTLIISTDIGPRILFYGYSEEQNVFKVFPEQIANIEPDVWKSYGGHRLWHAPEVYPRTYYPDNEPVPYEWDGKTLTFNCPVEKGTHIGKILTITLCEKGTEVSINHTLVNKGVWPVKLAAWCLSVMVAGGKVIVPQEDYKAHPDCLVPSRPLVLWHFTKMNDHRSIWGERYIQLIEDSNDSTKQKFGVRNSKGWAAYVLKNLVFIKRIPFFADAEYTDLGCNQEFYTEAGFLEVETLSPYIELQCEQSLSHLEKWMLAKVSTLESETDFDTLGMLAEKLR